MGCYSEIFFFIKAAHLKYTNLRIQQFQVLRLSEDFARFEFVLNVIFHNQNFFM